MSFVRFTPVMRFYWDGLRSITPIIRSYRYVLRSITPVMRFYRYVLRSITPVIRSSRYVLRSITPAVCRIAPNRTACDMLRSYSAVGRDRHSCVLGCRAVIRLCWFTSGLRVFWRRSRRNTKETRGRGERSRRRGVGALLRNHIGFAMFPAGSPLGATRPQTCAKEPLALWTLFMWVAAWVRFTRGGETRVQRRLARLQFMAGQVGRPFNRPCSRNPLSQAASSGSGHCPPPPDCAKETRLPGLSSFDSRQSAFYAARGLCVQRRLAQTSQ